MIELFQWYLFKHMMIWPQFTRKYKKWVCIQYIIYKERQKERDALK